MELKARAWPAGEARVIITVTPDLHGCTVTVQEDANSDPGKSIPLPVRQATLYWRNTETLGRSALLAGNR